MVKDLNLTGLEKQDKELKEKIKALEKELQKYPAFSMDINEMKKEVKRLEDVIRRTNPNSPLLQEEKAEEAKDLGPGLQVPDFGAASPATSAGGVSGTRMLQRKTKIRTAPQAYEQPLQISARLFEIERNKLVRHVQQRFNQYVQAFMVKRYTEARIDPDGSIALKNAETGKWVDFDHLTPAARDTIYLALQITLLELAIQKRTLPIILDNPATRLDETAIIVASKALKRIGERTQVILLSTQRAPLQYADHTVNLA